MDTRFRDCVSFCKKYCLIILIISIIFLIFALLTFVKEDRGHVSLARSVHTDVVGRYDLGSTL
jgi:hypothetical protein